MTSAFLTALRGAILRQGDGSVRNAAGAVLWCAVDASGSWALVSGPMAPYPIGQETWTKLRAIPHVVPLELVAVTFADASRAGITVAADPGGPIDPG